MKQPYNTTIYNTALYLRLSRDDELQGESGSIQTQRMMLRQYKKYGSQKGWERVNQDPPEGDGFQEITEEEARQMELPF